MKIRTLLVEDSTIEMQLMTRLLRDSKLELELTCATNGDDALAKYETAHHELVLTDWALGDNDSKIRDGISLAKEIKERADADKRFVYVILVTGAHPTRLREALEHGADEFVKKDDLLDELLPRVRVGKRIIEQVRRVNSLTRDVTRLSRTSKLLLPNGGFDEVAGHGLREVFEKIRAVAQSDATVLLRGENGTGKEEVALAIHQLSGRPLHKFVTVNCGAIPENLIESELFGHEKGAFTGADRRRVGKFEQCDDGTLFLDEIGEMPKDAQVKLLRVLQERHFERVGGNETIQTNVRVIAATNANLEELIQQKQFRDDLYYRLNVYPINLPRLCERGEDDILALAERFLHLNSSFKNVKGLTREAEEFLKAYQWPGNVRELKNFIERAVLNAHARGGGEIRPEHFGVDRPTAPANPSPVRSATSACPSAEELVNWFKEELAKMGRNEQINLEDFLTAVEARLILWIKGSAGSNAEKAERLGLSSDQYARRLTKANERFNRKG